jgi:enoyl-CoA hydratase/carnithine racemase
MSSQALGPRTAKLLFATGRVFDADDAWSYGLVDEVFDDVASLEVARDALIEEMVACAPGAIGDAKALVNDFVGQKIDKRPDRGERQAHRAPSCFRRGPRRGARLPRAS